jgi:hypothetical protein
MLIEINHSPMRLNLIKALILLRNCEENLTTRREIKTEKRTFNVESIDMSNAAIDSDSAFRKKITTTCVNIMSNTLCQ